MSTELQEKINADRVANKKLTDAIRLVQATAFEAESGLDPELVGLLDALKTVCTAAKYRLIQDAWLDKDRHEDNHVEDSHVEDSGVSSNYGSWICCNCGEDLSVLFDAYDDSLLREDSEVLGECTIKFCPVCGQRLVFRRGS